MGLLLNAIGNRSRRWNKQIDQCRLIFFVQITKDFSFPFDRQLPTFVGGRIQRIAKTKDRDIRNDLSHRWFFNRLDDRVDLRIAVGFLFRFSFVIQDSWRFIDQLKMFAEHECWNAIGTRRIEEVAMLRRMKILQSLTKGVGEEIIAIDHTGMIDACAQWRIGRIRPDLDGMDELVQEMNLNRRNVRRFRIYLCSTQVLRFTDISNLVNICFIPDADLTSSRIRSSNMFVESPCPSAFLFMMMSNVG